MTYIYGLFVHNESFYIGQTKDYIRRFSEHEEDIVKKRHTVKALNKVNIEDVEMRVICTLDTDNSFLICIVEGLYNSIYKPKNAIVWRSGRNTVRYKRISCGLAEKLLRVIKDNKELY